MDPFRCLIYLLPSDKPLGLRGELQHLFHNESTAGELSIYSLGKKYNDIQIYTLLNMYI
jgi:hypothetical protein